MTTAPMPIDQSANLGGGSGPASLAATGFRTPSQNRRTRSRLPADDRVSLDID